MQDHLKTYLAEHVFQEVSNNRKYYQQAQEKQQTLIDITPQQTLSIETTFANVEESKELSTDSNLQNIEKDYCEVFFFNDWLSYRVFYQVQFGVQMCNDSKNFTKLIGSGGMSIDTLNKIQKEQSIVYEIMVNQELELLKALFRVKYVVESVEPLEYLKMRIENVENDLKTTNKETYYEIISTRKERGIKYGARLISPDSYYHYNNINVGIIKFYPDSYEGLIRESDVDNSSSVCGNEWTFIEAQYYFLKWLRRLSAGEFYFEILEENRIIEVTKTTFATVESKSLVLSQREIALIYHYEGWFLIDENSNDEVRKYLQKDGTRHKSGKKFISHYRIVNGEFKDWLNQKNTIQNLKKIIPLLQNAKGINDAKEDLKQAIKNKESMF